MGNAPHALEEFRNWVSWAEDGPRPPTSEYYWTGDAPRLATADGSDSYADLVNAFATPGTELVNPTVGFGPFTLTAESVLSAQVMPIGAPGFFEVYITTTTDSFYYEFFEATVPADEWTTVSGVVGDLTSALDLADLATYAAAGDLSAAVVLLSTEPTRWRVSWLNITTAAPIPLRWRQRDDGLSGGPKQWRGVSSQQMSNRHRGYL